MKTKQLSFVVRSTYVLFALIVLTSFQDDKISEILKDYKPTNLVRKAVNEKLEKYKKITLERCRKEALERAELYVDSLVAAQLKIQASDTIYFPRKPQKPTAPSKIILNDSTDIGPIIKE